MKDIELINQISEIWDGFLLYFGIFLKQTQEEVFHVIPFTFLF